MHANSKSTQHVHVYDAGAHRLCRDQQIFTLWCELFAGRSGVGAASAALGLRNQMGTWISR